RTAVAAIVLHSLAALPFPGNHLVVVLKAGHQRVVKLPVVLKMVSAARGSDPLRIIHTQRPAADIHLVGAVVERFARAIDPEPVPVIGLYIVRVGTPRRR